ncbi:fungal-specific transcription factor domain-containing protein [Paraphoma chrysanthemicola]|uniref:Fungal-specific transcription factor domain-containing protein n=1 Tax=Paraphoma chrysanthemicola TaxID=798071 RepID=A0A8K0VZF9_9PLEO|nr:fungal-specific transcription factor domain-containing protein [Paraphoma chrysanthemicola]
MEDPSAKRTRQMVITSQMASRNPSNASSAMTPSFPDASTAQPEASVIMNPHMAEDIIVLEQYLTSKPTIASTAAGPYNTVSTSSSGPIVYLTVPRRRKGLAPSIDPGYTQREIIEQVLSPFADEVCQLYFSYLQPCFPILDEYTFRDLWSRDRTNISSALLCDMYAAALVYWDRSATLRQHPRPDVNFVWNQAVVALRDDFMGPTISTVHAALLDLVGRPVGAITGNIVNAGRVVTLAQSLGLHRDPTTWKVTRHEKNVRIRLWWGVLIHDYWSSMSHGMPPTVSSRYYDTPPVTLDIFATSSFSNENQNVLSTFVFLCELTRILGEILPCVYEIGLRPDEIYRRLRKIDCALDDWLDTLPSSLRLDTLTGGPRVNGTSNLWFAYLSIKLLACRLLYRATLKDDTQSQEARQYRLTQLREASLEVVNYVSSLNHDHFQEFWLPYTSYLLVTAATILLRCTIECGDLNTKASNVAKLVEFRISLQKARDESAWDLAEFCLEKCHEPIQKIADAMGTFSSSAPSEAVGAAIEPDTTARDAGDAGGSSASPTALLPMDLLEYPWDTMWDTFDGPWPLYT